MPSSRIDRRRLLTVAGLTGAAAATGMWRAGVVWPTAGPSSYTPNWPSVDQHPPAPEWFQDAKFGSYFLDSLGDRTAGSSTCIWTPNSHPNNQWRITAV